MRRRRAKAGAIALVTTLVAGSAAPAEEVSPIGTLTCTTSEVQADTAADRELSCALKPTAVDGAAADLKGYIARHDIADFPPGKSVWVWAVSQADPAAGAFDAVNMAGSYKGVTGGTTEGQQIGGRDGDVVLTPVTATTPAEAQAAPTALTLILAPARV